MPNAVLVVNGKKPCSECGMLLPVSMFQRQRRAVSGLKSECKHCRALEAREYYSLNKSKQREQQRRRIASLKKVVLTHYGNGKLACVKCGYSNTKALSIDHIEGGGTKHRKELHRNLYRYLIDNRFPLGYQTLCMNCQYVKRIDNQEQLRR